MSFTVTKEQIWDEAAMLLSEDGENSEYDRAIVELVTRLTPGASHDQDERRLYLLRVHRKALIRRAEGT